MTERVTVLVGDCVKTMAAMPADSVDAIVCDPPYGLEFMGKDWDKFGDRRQPGDENLPSGPGPLARATVRHGGSPSYGTEGNAAMLAFESWCADWGRAALRVLKPGGHILAFGGTRTYHRPTCGLEDAGFEIHDCIQWIHGQGFPKSLNVGKAIDKAAGATRPVIGKHTAPASSIYSQGEVAMDRDVDLTGPATEAAARWEGWGTALKPAQEPIVLARKPLAGTVAANIQQHGTGAINVAACRVGDEVLPEQKAGQAVIGTFERENMVTPERVGRWPANVILDEEAAAMLDATTGEQVARFFYCAKASKSERELGLDTFEEVRRSDGLEKDVENPRLRTSGRKNHHPTVKPIALMRYLVRLVTPPGGIVLDPFLGSGTTAMAALAEGLRCIGIERDPTYAEIARARIASSS